MMQLETHIKNIVFLVVVVCNTSVASSGYSVDISYPIHNYDIFNKSSTNNDGPMGNVAKERYEKFMEGCRNTYHKRDDSFPICDEEDEDRLKMNSDQPAISINYTDIGYKKMKVPTDIWGKIQNFWIANFDGSLEIPENNFNGKRNGEQEFWSKGNIYTNHWEAPSYMMPLGDEKYEHGSEELRDIIIDKMKGIIQEWTQQKVHFTSLYGIRIYPTNAILSPHVDRSPLVSSAIINVAQDVNEPWPLEIYDRNGNARNITLEPGDMVLYESHSLIHGRPFPLNGKYFANIFCHFAPYGPLNSEEIVDTYEIYDEKNDHWYIDDDEYDEEEDEDWDGEEDDWDDVDDYDDDNDDNDNEEEESHKEEKEEEIPKNSIEGEL